MTDYRDRWLEACRLLARTTAKLEAEWDCVAGEDETGCWAEAESARDYLDDHADELGEGVSASNGSGPLRAEIEETAEEVGS